MTDFSRSLRTANGPDDERSLLSSHGEESFRGSELDYIHVEIPGVQMQPQSGTTAALRNCEKTVLGPYLLILSLLGWRPLVANSTPARRFGNVVYVLFVWSLLATSYVLRILLCQKSFRPHFKEPHTNTSRVLPAPTISPSAIPFRDIVKHCPHLVSSIVVPESIHLLAYIYLFVFYRLKESEQLSSLIQTVFVQTVNSRSSNSSHKRLIIILRLILICGVLWLAIAVTSRCLDVVGIVHSGKTHMDYVLVVIDLLNHFVIHLVFMAIILNYVTQCQLLIFFVRCILLCIQERTLDMNTVMKNAHTVKEYMHGLNQQIATAASLCLFGFADLLSLAVYDFLWMLRDKSNSLLMASQVITLLLWLFMVIITLMQASRLTSICAKLRKAGLPVRVFGYRACSSLDLSSFMDFLGSLKLEAKLFSVPVRKGYVVGASAVLLLVLLLLVQLDRNFARHVNF